MRSSKLWDAVPVGSNPTPSACALERPRSYSVHSLATQSGPGSWLWALAEPLVAGSRALCLSHLPNERRAGESVLTRLGVDRVDVIH